MGQQEIGDRENFQVTSSWKLQTCRRVRMGKRVGKNWMPAFSRSIENASSNTDLGVFKPMGSYWARSNPPLVPWLGRRPRGPHSPTLSAAPEPADRTTHGVSMKCQGFFPWINPDNTFPFWEMKERPRIWLFVVTYCRCISIDGMEDGVWIFCK